MGLKYNDWYNMTWLVTVIAVIYLVTLASTQNSCPAEYLRFSKDHSFCKKANPSCSFLAKGLQNEAAEISEILETHNNYRSKVATGKEKGAGGLPTAANMLELTWDEELQSVAQKWAEQCKFEHDCNECRSVSSFSVGQNIGYIQYPCQGNCNTEPNWKGIIASFYDEVRNFDKKLVKSVSFSGSKEIGHFTQVIWAKTYKIGCGYVVYKVGNDARQFYVCDYGPAGNVVGASVYEEGPSCSNCPLNSCCGDKCQGKNYAGLCQLKSSPPVYPPPKNLLFYCDFGDNEPNCKYNSVGDETWNLEKTEGGTFLSVVVSQQKNAIASFQKSFTSNNGFCMRLSVRKGPIIAGEKDDSTLEAEFDSGNGQKVPVTLWSTTWPGFLDTAVSIPWLKGDIKFSIQFSVPANTPQQFLEVQKIEVFDKNCD